MGKLFKQKYRRKDGRSGESKKWYGKVRLANGRWRSVPLSTDKQAAQAMYRELLSREERRRAGLVDEFAESLTTGIQELVPKYLKHLELKGRCPRHVRDTTRLLDRVLEGCGFVALK